MTTERQAEAVAMLSDVELFNLVAHRSKIGDTRLEYDPEALRSLVAEARRRGMEVWQPYAQIVAPATPRKRRGGAEEEQLER